MPDSQPPADLSGSRGVQIGDRNVQVNYFTAGRSGPGTADVPAGRPLAQVIDPFALEVHRPVQPDSLQPALPLLPPYVPREHDQELAETVRAAAAGTSGIAVLVGGSSTGKTRACWEALNILREQPEQWRLWHPIDPSRPEAALLELPSIGPRTVIWLNEAQFYLDAPGGLGEQIAAGLRELLRDPGRAPVLVMATLWPQYWDTFSARPSPAVADPHAQVRELLTGWDVTVPTAFNLAQLREVSSADDPRLVLALEEAEDGQVIQFLAGAPELMARYRNAPPAVAALINAAIDARRLGMGTALPLTFLEQAASGYLTDAEWDQLTENWLEQALAYTATPCKGVRGPLTRIRPRPGAVPTYGIDIGLMYRLADYLDQQGRRNRRDRIPPASFWAATRHADTSDLYALAQAAEDRGLLRNAAQLYKNAAAHGISAAAGALIDVMRALCPTDPRPVRWAIARTWLNNPDGVAKLLDSLQKAGAHEQTAELLGRDPAAQVSLNNTYGVAEMLDSLQKASAHEQTAKLLGRDPASQVSLNNTYDVAKLLDSLQKAGAHEQIAVLAARAVAHLPLDDPRSVDTLLDSLLKVGAHEQVTVLLARDPATHVSLNNPDGVGSLLFRLQHAGAHEQSAELAARAAAHTPFDEPFGVSTLLGSLQQVGAHEQILVLLARDPATFISLDDPDGVAYLIESLQDISAHEQATALAARAATHVPLDDPEDVASLLDTLETTGTQDQAALLARDPATHAFLDDPFGVATLLDNLRYHGAQEQAFALLARDPAAHVSLDYPFGVGFLLNSLRDADAHEQAAALASRAAAHLPRNDPHGVAQLLDSMRHGDAQEQAAMLSTRLAAAGMFKLFLKQLGTEDSFRFGREPDGVPATQWDWDDLD